MAASHVISCILHLRKKRRLTTHGTTLGHPVMISMYPCEHNYLILAEASLLPVTLEHHHQRKAEELLRVLTQGRTTAQCISEPASRCSLYLLAKERKKNYEDARHETVAARTALKTTASVIGLNSRLVFLSFKAPLKIIDLTIPLLWTLVWMPFLYLIQTLRETDERCVRRT
jgi:hypothetical protein